MSCSNFIEFEEEEIEAAFAAGAMPPEWRPRLLASGWLDVNDVDLIAAAIERTHWISGGTSWSKENSVLKACGLLGGLFMFVLAVVFRNRQEGVMAGLLIWGLLFVGLTFIFAVFDEYKRRRAKVIRELARTVLHKLNAFS